ncbi:NAD-dependent epimerase/dehydratase family protein [Elizabethkingia anophelis]|uniref:NAD-dependent epimerase/dehydratase family protein n=1 Tax=Elizabethkingia anophelis TaxID=1117645 RepID=UPI0004E2AD7E|nr:NAD-dependent epimerase/dehydratase family protein [Elizabethkingia anophelis]KFC33541.1 epimerase [Elizabethkingia anophelis]MCL1031982.1 NAD-dependent epimerase/dehydratase family protein [Elizabethkingia anophelis]MCT3785924.1 NAD-dependent epimerase/dehydratase family protein [Elizabethkingia anophelis]MCT3897762.1 NAD-dependent epimerase/dehydratase family protein [Elizabethkingia anophelis]MCT3922294.1 NAD-dependent epimerase/dehydratase family protein [Elizabethkingia anophelis]
MKLKVIITGATGMVGEGVLQESISNPNVEKILLINRKPSGYTHPKIEEILHSDFSDISALTSQVTGYNACFFCLGVSSIGMNEEQYTKVTYDLTLGFAKTLAEVNPQMTFCYVSGASTDSTEKGKQMWARVKGKTENDLMKLPFKAVYNFRPGFMKPTKDAKNIKGFFKFINAVYPLLRAISSTYFLTLEEVGKAMINAVLHGYPKHVLEVGDIKKLSIG